MVVMMSGDVITLMIVMSDDVGSSMYLSEPSSYLLRQLHDR